MSYEQKYNKALEKARQLCAYPTTKPFMRDLQDLFPELKETEDELTWLTNYIEEEAYILSMDIRDDEDRIKLQKLQKALAWLKKQEFSTRKDVDDAYLNGVCAAKHELEKQSEKSKTNAVPKSHDEDKRFINILQNIVKGACSKYGIKWNGVETSEKDLLAWIETHKYTEEDLDKAYKCADKVQYMSGYNDAKEEFEKQDKERFSLNEKAIADIFEKVGLAKIVREEGSNRLTNVVQMAMIELAKQTNSEFKESEDVNMV